MTIREIVERDRGDWVRLREALWPGSLSDHDRETRKYFEERPDAPIIFVAEAGGKLVPRKRDSVIARALPMGHECRPF
jgi:hypothetical protein